MSIVSDSEFVQLKKLEHLLKRSMLSFRFSCVFGDRIDIRDKKKISRKIPRILNMLNTISKQQYIKKLELNNDTNSIYA